MSAPENVDAEGYECPDCGAVHDGMTTGTEQCPDCLWDTEAEQ